MNSRQYAFVSSCSRGRSTGSPRVLPRTWRGRALALPASSQKRHSRRRRPMFTLSFAFADRVRWRGLERWRWRSTTIW